VTDIVAFQEYEVEEKIPVKKTMPSEKQPDKKDEKKDTDMKDVKDDKKTEEKQDKKEDKEMVDAKVE